MNAGPSGTTLPSTTTWNSSSASPITKRSIGSSQDANNVFGKQKAAARRKPGVHEQRFLAQVALVIDWLQICLRHGYIGSHPKCNANELRDDTEKGRLRLEVTLRKRQREGLNVPYGPVAVACGYALPRPAD